MDIRLIFRNYLLHVITMGRRRRLAEAYDWTCRLQACREIRQANPVGHYS